VATYVETLVQIRDNMVAEMAAESARRLAIVQAGGVPVQTYSVDGRSMSHTDWTRMMRAEIKELNEQILAAGGGGGFGECTARGYT
jgi:hypothetical protein